MGEPTYHYDYYFEKNGEEVKLRPNNAKGLSLLRKVPRKYSCGKCNGKKHEYRSKTGQNHLEHRIE